MSSRTRIAAQRSVQSAFCAQTTQARITTRALLTARRALPRRRTRAPPPARRACLSLLLTGRRMHVYLTVVLVETSTRAASPLVLLQESPWPLLSSSGALWASSAGGSSAGERRRFRCDLGSKRSIDGFRAWRPSGHWVPDEDEFILFKRWPCSSRMLS
eukprot:XP_001709558.1 Hypothetical protein GL50803_38163 [Giardia lamblia ATCC 50803]